MSGRDSLERRQVRIYLLAIAVGLATGAAAPGVAAAFEALLWPALGALLFATFAQIPLLHLRAAFRDRAFVAATLLGNFVLLPLVAWSLVQLLPPDPAPRLGVLLVLLVPCTDWFIAFAQQGGGDGARALAVTPLNLALQFLLLPAWVWLATGVDAAGTLTLANLWPALLVVGVPLVLAALFERWVEAGVGRSRRRVAVAAWPVPLLATVVFLVAAAQARTVVESLPQIAATVPAFLAFLLVAALLARLLARGLRLGTAAARTLAFGFGTRNSFVVLPFALALPAGWELAAVVIVVQSLVELLGMAVWLRWVPRRLFKE